jgi:hypothetical protein
MSASGDDQVEMSGGDAGAAADYAGARRRTVAIVGAAAVLLVAGAVVAGTVARTWAAGSSTGTATVQETAAPTAAADLHTMVSHICGASEADMEHRVTVARNTSPDAERFDDFLGYEAYAIDQVCPDVRSTYDAATLAAADIRLGIGEDNPTAP